MPEDLCKCYSFISWGPESTDVIVTAGSFSIVTAGATRTRSRSIVVNRQATISTRKYICESGIITSTTNSTVNLSHRTGFETQTSVRYKKTYTVTLPFIPPFNITSPFWSWSPWGAGLITFIRLFSIQEAMGRYTPICAD